MPLRVVAGTIIARNYLAHARVWARSFRGHHPGARVAVLLVDRNEGAVDPAAEPFELHEAADLGLPAFPEMAFRYSRLELCTAVKPAFLERLLATGDEEAALFFDPDVLVLAPVSPVLDALRTATAVLTPHALAPLPDDGRRPADEDLLVSGACNLGFVGVRRSPEGSRLLSWWRERLVRGSLAAPARGLFTDQKWMDLAPSYFDRVELLRDPSLNAAYWNLHERGDLGTADGSFTVAGRPLRFFHFSGFSPDRPGVVSRHQDRFGPEDLAPAVRALFAAYAEELAGQGRDSVQHLPYAYGAFDDGEPVTPEWRAAFRDARVRGLAWDDPFRTGPGSFREWALSPGGDGEEAPPFVRAVWSERPDVRGAFPRGPDGELEALLDWVLGVGAATLGIGPATRTGLGGSAPERPPRQASAIDTLRALLTEPHVPSGARAAFECPPGSPGARVAQALLGKTLYRRLRFHRWGAASRSPLAHLRARTAADAAPASPRAPGSGHPYRITPVSSPRGVNLFGYLDTESGVGEVARSFVRLLRAEGIPVAPVNVPQDGLRRRDTSIGPTSTGTPHPVNLFFVNADQLPHLLAGRRGLLDGRRSAGYWFWELEEFPERFDGALRLVDEVWVASTFCQRAIAARARVPVVCVPPVLDPSRFPAPDRHRFGLADDDLVFLHVFDAASFPRRKNPGAAVAAFRRAFPVSGREVLVVKATGASRRQVQALRRLARASRVVVLDGYLDREALLALTASADVAVSLHRSEGLALTLLEAMAAGKPVVATAYGGCTDFLRPDAARLVPYRRVRVGRQVGPYPAAASWAEPDVEAAAAALRELASDRPLAARLGARGRAVLDEWSGGTAALLRHRLELLAADRPSGR